jgi:hypothetical protein
MLAPSPFTTATWPIAGDAPDLRAIVQAQAVVIADNAVLIDAYQTNLNTAQASPAPLPTATGNGTAAAAPNGAQLTVSGVTGGNIVIGAVIAGPGIPTGTTILSQQSGTAGGAGVYTTSVATTAASAALTFTPPPQPSPWPTLTDAMDLNAIMQAGTAIIRTQTALLQQYQDLLNTSQTPAPPTGP